MAWHPSGTDILLTHTHWPLWAAAPAALAGTTLLAALLGGVALRTAGIAFAMVTLAFAQVGVVLVDRDPGGLTGGEEGLPLDAERLPAALVGVTNTINLYWLALGFLAVAVFVVHQIDRAPLGRVLAGLRDDEPRVCVVGLSPYRFKLLAFTLSASTAALGGVVYTLVVGGTSPRTSPAPTQPCRCSSWWSSAVPAPAGARSSAASSTPTSTSDSPRPVRTCPDR